MGDDKERDPAIEATRRQRSNDGGEMSEKANPKNLMNSDHKATNDKYRDNYDRVKWGKRNRGKK